MEYAECLIIDWYIRTLIGNHPNSLTVLTPGRLVVVLWQHGGEIHTPKTIKYEQQNSSDNVCDLEECCASASISLDILQEKISDVSSPTALSCSHFLHTLVLNENVTLRMVEYWFCKSTPMQHIYSCSNRFI